MAIQITPWGFDSSQLEALGRVREGEAGFDRPFPGEGLTGGEGIGVGKQEGVQEHI